MFKLEEKECICFIHDVYATDPSINVKLNKVYQETITTNIAELLLINAWTPVNIENYYYASTTSSKAKVETQFYLSFICVSFDVKSF